MAKYFTKEENSSQPFYTRGNERRIAIIGIARPHVAEAYLVLDGLLVLHYNIKHSLKISVRPSRNLSLRWSYNVKTRGLPLSFVPPDVAVALSPFI